MEVFFYSALGVAMLFTVLTTVDKEEIAWPLLAFVSWFVTAGLSSKVDQIRTFLLSDNTVLEHTVTAFGGAFGILFFAGIGLVFVAIFFNRIWSIYRETVRRR